MNIVYHCNSISYSTPVTIDGKVQRITFKGGSYGGGMTTNARFSTSDKAMQEQIEGSAAFKTGQIWIASRTPEATDTVAPAEKNVEPAAPVAPMVPETSADKVEEVTTDLTVAPEVTPEPAVTAPAETGDGATDKVEESITGFQKAKNLLVTKYSITFPANVTKEIVLAAAKELGVTFPNWK